MYLGFWVFHRSRRAANLHSVNLSLVLVPPLWVKEAVFEAIDAGISTIIVYTEGVPIHDSLQMIYTQADDFCRFRAELRWRGLSRGWQISVI